MASSDSYELFRNLTSPIMALTCASGDRRNGMILNSAIRASLIPTKPRVAVFVLKRHLSHDLLFESGAFGLHLLHTMNWDVIWELGFHSGRDREKLAQFEHRIGGTGSPLLEDSYARFDCRVINVMDAGASTCFMGEALAVERGRGESVMTAPYFREHMPEAWRPLYEANLAETQEWALSFGDAIKPVIWKTLES